MLVERRQETREREMQHISLGWNLNRGSFEFMVGTSNPKQAGRPPHLIFTDFFIYTNETKRKRNQIKFECMYNLQVLK